MTQICGQSLKYVGYSLNMWEMAWVCVKWLKSELDMWEMT